jgi:hypothetical protein
LWGGTVMWAKLRSRVLPTVLIYYLRKKKVLPTKRQLIIT